MDGHKQVSMSKLSIVAVHLCLKALLICGIPKLIVRVLSQQGASEWFCMTYIQGECVEMNIQLCLVKCPRRMI